MGVVEHVNEEHRVNVSKSKVIRCSRLEMGVKCMQDKMDKDCFK